MKEILVVCIIVYYILIMLLMDRLGGVMFLAVEDMKEWIILLDLK